MVLRSAVIGAGHSAINGHLPALDKNPRTELVGVCDIDEERAKEAASDFQTEWYINFEELLTEDIDWIHICTPVQTHFDLASSALREGIHTLIQKPITETVEEMEELAELANKNDVSVSAVHNRAFFPVMRKLRREIEAGDFGDIIGVTTVLSGEGRPDQTPRGSWVFDLQGGELEEGFPHPIYLTLVVGGYPADDQDVKAFSRRLDTYDHGIKYDGVSVDYISKNGALCNVEIFSRSLPQKIIHVYGTKKTATIDLDAMTFVGRTSGSESPVSAMKGKIGDASQLFTEVIRNGISFTKFIKETKLKRHSEESVSGTYYQINAAARAIENGTEQPVSIEEALWTMKLMRSIRETSERPVLDESVGE